MPAFSTAEFYKVGEGTGKLAVGVTFPRKVEFEPGDVKTRCARSSYLCTPLCWGGKLDGLRGGGVFLLSCGRIHAEAASSNLVNTRSVPRRPGYAGAEGPGRWTPPEQHK
ncbi:unnamed protein product [Rangifer tarandus platyrhynchus]|uniref:Uncharacterized protein n=1 Tax=Rangifer tarandus platyrhynchus TaxID=3082113 RepID=A0AC59ZB03_RANTA